MGLFYNYTKPFAEVADRLPRDAINHPSYGRWEKNARLDPDATISDIAPCYTRKITSVWEAHHMTLCVEFTDGFVFIVDKKCEATGGFMSVHRSCSKEAVEEAAYEAIEEHLLALKIQAEEDEKKRSATTERPEASTFSAPEEIAKYKELLDNGAITQEEYEAKKKQLLGI